jgi:hypothetical protein
MMAYSRPLQLETVGNMMAYILQATAIGNSWKYDGILQATAIVNSVLNLQLNLLL